MKKTASTFTLYKLHVISLVVLTTLGYLLWFVTLDTQRRQISVAAFDDIHYELKAHLQYSSANIKETLITHVDRNNVTYQVMLMTPSGLPFVHNYHRVDQETANFFTLPYWGDTTQNSLFYKENYRELLGWTPLPNGYEAYIQVIHPPLLFDWQNPIYWFPAIAALILFFIGLSIRLRRNAAWHYLIEYSQHFPSHLSEPYAPLRQNALAADKDFRRLASSLNRINQQLHQSYRRNRNLNKRLQRISDFAPLPLLLISRNGEVSYFNKRFEQTFLTVFQEDVRYFVTDFLTGKDKHTQQDLTRLGNLRTPRTYMVSSLENNIDYLLHLQPWTGEQGQVQGFCSMLTDISSFTLELKDVGLKVEQQVNKLAEFDKLWSVLGHELRTPLSGMMGLLELMPTANFDDTQKETHTALEQTGKGMLALLNDMLDMAKMEAGKLQVVNEQVDLASMSQQLMELMAGSARRKNIELLCYFEPDFPRYLDTDLGRLRQSLMNLLSNAIKFTQTGYVALIARRLSPSDPLIVERAKQSARIKRNANKDWVCFTIKDTGIGITGDEKSRLFSRFNQANESISLQFGGTGLGLAISNSFTQLLNGFIHVESTSGEGSEFSLCLPQLEPAGFVVYEPNPQLSTVSLLAFSSQQISTEALKTFADYAGMGCLAYTGVPQNSADDIKAFTHCNNSDSTLIVLVEEEVYDKEGMASRLKQVLQLPSIRQAPKILLSMQPKAAISSERRAQYQAFLTKPISWTMLSKQLPDLLTSSVGSSKQFTNEQIRAEQQHKRLLQTVPEALPLLPAKVAVDTPLLLLPKPNPPLILVAEDDRINQMVAKKLIERLGYRCLTADNGAEAIALINQKSDNKQFDEKQTNDIKLILMDCNMPIVDGFEATRRIRMQLKDVPIVALTAGDTEADTEACLQAGMNSVLSKPITKDALLKVLQDFDI